MHTIEQVLSITRNQMFQWLRYLLDSILASAGSLLVTEVIGVFHLYPAIPNISIVYLLVVLALAITRGWYAAIFSAVVAFLSFAYFIVPPRYNFAIDLVGGWIALFVFLTAALLTGQLAVALSERVEQANRRERETRQLYEATRAGLYEFLNQAPVRIMALRGPEHRVEFVNLAASQIKRYADRVGKTIREGWPELVEQGILAILDEVYTSGTTFIGTEVPLKVDRTGDGVLSETYFNLVYQPLHNAQEEIDGLLLYSMEVTEQVQVRHRLEELNRQLDAEKDALRQATQEAEARASELEEILEAMTEGVFVCDARGEIRYTNAAYRSLLVLREDADPSLLQLDHRFAWPATRDLEGRLLPKEQHPLLRVLRGERLSGAHRVDLICRTYKGEDLILNVSGAPIRDAAGQIMGGVIAFRDVTEWRKLEQQLQYSERKLSMLVDSNIFGVWVVDGAGRVYEVNDRLVQMLGYSREELLSGTIHCQQLTPPEYQEALAQSSKTILSAGGLTPVREGMPAQGRQSLTRPGGGSYD